MTYLIFTIPLQSGYFEHPRNEPLLDLLNTISEPQFGHFGLLSPTSSSILYAAGDLIRFTSG